MRANGATARVAAWDGMRGLAVAGVLAYHLGLRPLHGGFLGVSAFFTLSGFLITSLLLDELDDTGRISLRSFWARRMRRLLPAATALVVLVLVLARPIADGTQQAHLRGDLLAMVAYVANWRFLLSGQDYGGLVLSPSLVLHAWSLSIEEQFYLFFPAAMALAHRVAGRRGVTAVLTLGAAGSVLATALAAGDAQRVYFGTDVRALELLVGAGAALAVRGAAGPALRRGATWLAAPALVGILVSWSVATETSQWLARGGFALHALATAVVIVAAGEATRLARGLAWRPLAWLGSLSYGIYLYHWPLFLWLTPRRLGTSTLGAAPARLAATFALALLSARFLEQPVRARVQVPAAATLRLGALATMLTGLLVLGVAPLPDQGSRIAISDGLVAPAAAASPAGTDDRADPVAGDPERADPADATTVAPRSAKAAFAGDEQRPVTPTETAATTTVTPAARPDPRTLLSPALPDPLPPARTRRPRVLVVGDSAAGTLGDGLQRWGTATGAMDVWVSGWISCPITRGGQLRWLDGLVFTPRRDCARWPALRANDLARLKPDVVVVLDGTWEVVDRKLKGDGTWRHIGDPVLDSRITADLAAFTQLQRSRGAVVVWLQHPEIRTSVMAKLPGPMPEEEPARMARLNEIIRAVATGKRTYVLDLPVYLRTEPGGGEMAHRPDGFHWSKDGADAEAQWLGPLLADVARVRTSSGR